MNRPWRVYFMRPVGMPGPVKIGCSRGCNKRLETYLSWSPYVLELAAVIEGGFDLEARFHAAFAQQRTHHEWFSASPELSTLIAKIADGTFDLAELPPPNGRYSGHRHGPWSPETKLAFYMRRSVEHLKDQGIGAPRDVYLALRRYGKHGLENESLPRVPADAELVQEFLAPHLEDLPDKVRLLQFARETGIDRLAA